MVPRRNHSPRPTMLHKSWPQIPDKPSFACRQVHPTGLVHPDEPEAKVKFLAAEALRGVGGVLIDREGNRFADELGRRDYVRCLSALEL